MKKLFNLHFVTRCHEKKSKMFVEKKLRVRTVLLTFFFVLQLSLGTPYSRERQRSLSTLMSVRLCYSTCFFSTSLLLESWHKSLYLPRFFSFFSSVNFRNEVYFTFFSLLRFSFFFILSSFLII